MIVKLDIVKAAKVLTERNIQNYYIAVNSDKSLDEVQNIIYDFEETRDKKGNIVKVRTFKPEVAEQAKVIYKEYFKTLKYCKDL